MEQRRDLEKKFLEMKMISVDTNDANLERLRIDDNEEYTVLKLALEAEIQLLEQQIQQLRTTCLLNSEKLEYNYQVLKKRDDENSVTVAQQKRKITRLQDQLVSYHSTEVPSC